MRFRSQAAIFVAICAASAFGQNSLSISSIPAPAGTAHFGAAMPYEMRFVVTGAPYAGEQVGEHVQTLADGTHITQKQELTKVYRDSLGRTRTEHPLFRGVALAGHAPDSPVVIEIIDPVAQVKYTLDTVNKVAHRQRLPSPDLRPAKTAIGTSVTRAGVLGGSIGATGVTAATASEGAFANVPPVSVPAPPLVSDERLGTQTIEGVLAEGTRHTTTWPAGSQGNDRPISAVSEMWTSPELKVMILSKSNDPRSGESTQKLIHISRDEPSLSLFEPPPEYMVVDEEGDFTIKWGPQ